MSSDNPLEKGGRRKRKVSYATLIGVGLVGPKARPEGVVDGQAVNILLLVVSNKDENGGQRWNSVAGC